MTQVVKSSPEMWEIWVPSMGLKDPLEKGMATHSSILAWEIPWTEEPGGLQSLESQRVGHNWVTKHSTAQSIKMNMCFIAQLYLTLCDPMDCRLPGSPVHGILQARILDWVSIPFSRGSSLPRDWTQVSCTADRFFTFWATRETQRWI